MPKVDLHTHILPPPEEWGDLDARFGYPGFVALKAKRAEDGRCVCADMVQRGRVFRTIESNCWDPEVRLKEMDAAGVDAQVLSTVPVMFSSWARPADTLWVARWLNDHLAGVVDARPERFVGLGMIPMNAPDLACKEMERCVRGLGMAGVQIGTNVNGVDLGDAELREVFACAEELGAGVFVHPWDMMCWGGGGGVTPRLAVPMGETPVAPELPVRLRKFWMAWLVGMPSETALAVCSVLFSGMLEALPRLRICFAHGGGSFPGTIGRIEHGFAARPDLCQTQTTTSPGRFLRRDEGGVITPARFYVDGLVHEPRALRVLLELMGPERVAMGSDYPFPLGEDRPGELVESMMELDGPTRRRLLCETALEFLGPAAGRLGAALRLWAGNGGWVGWVWAAKDSAWRT